MTQPRLVVAEGSGLAPDALAALQRCSEVTVLDAPPSATDDLLHEFDILWIKLGLPIRGPLGPEARCRLIATPTTGLDHIDLAACSTAGVEVLSLKGDTEFLRGVPATAELTIALCLAVLRRLVPAAASTKRGSWDRDRFVGRDLADQRVGVIGLGRLGQMVALLYSAFGADVVGSDPQVTSAPPGVRGVVSLPELLASSDVVSVHASYEGGQPPILGAREFSVMRPGTVLVNTARGGLVDEGALLAAFDSGRLAGAALDVITGEPGVTSDHPLVARAADDDRLLLTPHIGGNTVGSARKTQLHLAQKICTSVSSW